jgi:hypothetical protein
MAVGVAVSASGAAVGVGCTCAEATSDAVGGLVPPSQAARKAAAIRRTPGATRFIRRAKILIVKIIPAFPARHPYRKLSPPGLSARLMVTRLPQKYDTIPPSACAVKHRKRSLI